MPATHLTGPNVTTGYYTGSGGSNAEAGPGATYQGDCVLDPRYPYLPGMTGLGHVKGFLNHPYPTLVDGVPQTLSAALICPALAASTAVSVAAQAFPLQTTTTAGRAVGVPLVPFGSALSAANAVSVMALDPGHTVGTASAGATSVTSVGDTRLIPLGCRIGIVGGGASANTVSTHLVTAKTGTTLTITPAITSAVTAKPILILDPNGVSAWPFINQGAVAVFDSYSALARAVSVTTTGNNTADAGYIVTVTGYDIYGVLMSEAITSVNASAGTVLIANGKKAFKYISSVTIARGTGGATVAGSISVGTTDIFGFNLRTEFWEYATVSWNGAPVSANTGFVAALATGTASTTTTADTRGTYAVQSASDASKRIVMLASIPLRQILGTTYTDVTPLFGQAQA